jgi:hypothetical protein
MTLRVVSASFRGFVPRAVPTIFHVKRSLIPPAQRNFGTWTTKLLELVTGMKRLNPQETEQAIIDHQKLWVAHASINNHPQAHDHYELFYSMQLFRQPKNFEVQKYYSGLVLDKKGEELSLEETQRVVALYQFAIARNRDPFAVFDLNAKLRHYQAHLDKRSE